MAEEETKSPKTPRHIEYFDYKDAKQLQRYLNQYGQIEARRKTSLTPKQQHQLAVAIKRARHLALLPFMIR
jgi:small subunit ribosomal protein S18